MRARAIEKGLVAADAQLTEAEIFAFILAPGFSTARQVTDVSGRGVGMDVVRRSVEALRGTIDIASKPGSGTSVTLRLPLTLAIIDGLLVRVGHAYFVLPLATTLECIELTRQDIEQANGKHVANVRGEIIPYIRLREYFNMRTERPEREQIMVAETEEGRYGFVVDQVLGDHQTVIKNLGRFYRHVRSGIRRHHSRQRNRGVDSRSAPAGPGGDPDHGAGKRPLGARANAALLRRRLRAPDAGASSWRHSVAAEGMACS